MDQVSESSTSYRTVTFVDKNGAPQAPASASYRVDCLTTGVAIRAPTALTPAATIEITLTPADNVIQNQGDPICVRRVTVTGVYNETDQVVQQFDHEVLNLSHFP